MECNKEEATRAKEIAANKMENRDFVGAHKVALRAQQLYPNLEDISQMIMVCDVHISAESKVFGNDKDWYAILKVDPTADEALIRKQYRKFALLLHPDKNKFQGAADAFKLVSEAQKLLLDREKRLSYDSRYKTFRRPSVPNWASQNTHWQATGVKQPFAQNDIRSNVPSQFVNQASVNRQTFWTACPFCGVRYQYYREMVNRSLQCPGPTCMRTFTAYEINAQGAVFVNKVNQFSKVESQSIFANSTKEGVLKDIPNAKSPRNSKVETDTKGKAKDQLEESKQSRKMNSKKYKKPVGESSESCTTGSSLGSEDAFEEVGNHQLGKNFGFENENEPRRSTRSKKHVSYSENLSDDDDLKPIKRAKYTVSPSLSKDGYKEVCTVDTSADLGSDMEENEKEVKQTESLPNEFRNMEEASRISNDNETTEDKEEKICEPVMYAYNDPEFKDFDKDRKEECFAAGQIWAVYDDHDAMPRFYAHIRKVYRGGFKLSITWLEAEPDNLDGCQWREKNLPISCGKFSYGVTEDTEDHAMFSHFMFSKKFRKERTQYIFPKRGETWALFKDWDINWHSEPVVKTKFDYEFVLVLSDYSEDFGTTVAFLGKIKGFACLFGRQKDVDSFLIPPQEVLRFSHRVPSVKMTGEERADVPRGCFELDPAGLLPNLEGTISPEELENDQC